MPRLPVRRMLPVLLIGVFILSATASFAQSAGQYIARGDKELKDGYPQSALFYYRLALGIDTHDVEANFKAGEAYRTLRNYDRAAAYYGDASEVDSKDEYLESIFWLGMMQKQMGEYSSAKRNFQYFLSVYRQRDDFYRWARDELASCDWAIDHQGDDPQMKVSLPDSGLNTIHAEMSPFLFDSNTLYFATMRYESEVVKKNKPVYVEMKKAVKDSVWSLVDMDVPVNDDNAHVGNGCFSKDSSRFYFSKCATTADCKIYVTRMTDAGWSQPEKLDNPVNEDGSLSTQPMIATLGEEEYLFFVSDRGTGKGGMDIWYVEVKRGEPTTRIRNLGTRINTKGNEITPWFDASDTTLYFSSNRQLGFGGFDIYKSKGAPGTFNLVENAGTEVNSPADDYYFTFHSKDSLGYFASNRISGVKEAGNETCCNDLYKVRLVPPIDSIEVIDSVEVDTVEIEIDSTAIVDVLETEQPDSTETAVVEEVPVPETIEELQRLLPISLYFHNDRPNPRSTGTTTGRNYLQTVNEYLALEAEYMQAVDNSALSAEQKAQMRQELQGFFARNVKQSVGRLDAALAVVLKELESGTDIELAVKGYASPLANSDYNLNLTYRRINAMENYFRSYENGALVPYIDNTSADGGQLTIVKIPYGETKASSDISDDLNDKLGAIYSPKATLERRIEVLRVEKKGEDSE